MAMLSRVADHLYWMSRYLERAQHTARLLDVALDMIPDRSPAAVARSWETLFASLNVTPPEDLPRKPRHIPNFLAFDEENGPSIAHHMTVARENARQVRELISSEMWEQVNRLYLDVQTTNINRIWGQSSEFLSSVKQGAHLFQGITDSTMNRGEGWHFIQLGQYTERAGNVAALLNAHIDDHLASTQQGADQYLELLGLLRSCTAFEAYCKVYSAELHFEEVAEFLLLNDTFPFSVNFAASQMRAGLESIADLTDTRRNNLLIRRAGRLKAMLDYEQIDELIAGGLRRHLDTVQSLSAQIHSGVHDNYIAYSVEDKLTTLV